MSHAAGMPLVQSVDRALAILAILGRVGECGVSDIARELEVHKSTVFRLMATLEAHDMVEQPAGRGKYRLGVGVLRLAGSTTARLDVVQEARPIARELAATTGETVNLAILSDHSALYIDQVAGASSLQPHNWVGQRIPLHATSNGKVLLSALEEGEMLRVAGPLTRYTDSTITTAARLRAECVAAAQQGFAVAIDEMEVGLTAVAAPVLDAHGDIVASLSVSGPTFRIPAERVEHVVPALREAAAAVSARLGAGSDTG